MKPTLVKDRTHCAKGHDLRVHGYYFGSNQRCRACNRRGVRGEDTGLKNQMSGERVISASSQSRESQTEHRLSNDTVVNVPALLPIFNA
jgi:hypothetical protein